MKRMLITSTLISTMLAVSVGPAVASDAFDGPSEFSWVPQTSGLTRAQVRDDLIQAQQAGRVVQHDTVYPKAVSGAQSAAGATPVTAGSVGGLQQAGTTYFGN